MISRFRLLPSLLAIVLCIVALPASAELREMGSDFRRMLSNYHMTATIAQQCPELEMPELVARPLVERSMQEKVGMEAFVNLMIAIQKSDLRSNAAATVEKLMTQVEGCDDERLPVVLERIANVHSEAYQRFQQAPALVKPKDVPVPLRRN